MLPTTIDGWVDYTQTLHDRTIDLTLDRVAEVRDRLNLNPLPCRAISVAGTNGKGSTVSMLESIYQKAGYRTACYTSPHLVSYNERIRVDGAPVDTPELLEAFDAVERAREQTPLTYFEFGTLIAAHIIRNSKVDIALLEVGLGGRLDAVKVLSSDLSIITSIGIDHQAWLGPDRETIGREKAGIMHEDGKAVCAESECPNSIIEEARRNRVDLWCIGTQFGFEYVGSDSPRQWRWWCRQQQSREYGVLPPPGLAGRHQYYNASGVVAAIDRMQEYLPVAVEELAAGLKTASLAGRLQRISEQPMCLVDVAHNVEAVLQLRSYMDRHPVSGRTYAIMGMLEDKPVGECVDVISEQIDEWFLADLEVDRGLSSDQLNQIVTERLSGPVTHSFHDPVQAWRTASERATRDDRIIAFGSFHTVGDILASLKSGSI